MGPTARMHRHTAPLAASRSGRTGLSYAYRHGHAPRRRALPTTSPGGTGWEGKAVRRGRRRRTPPSPSLAQRQPQRHRGDSLRRCRCANGPPGTSWKPRLDHASSRVFKNEAGRAVKPKPGWCLSRQGCTAWGCPSGNAGNGGHGGPSHPRQQSSHRCGPSVPIWTPRSNPRQSRASGRCIRADEDGRTPPDTGQPSTSSHRSAMPHGPGCG